MTSKERQTHPRNVGPCFLAAALLLVCPVWGQFTIERSPWLDSPKITDDSFYQEWTISNEETNEPLHVEVSVEGINPRKTVHFNIDTTRLFSLQPFRRYTRICVEPEYMLHADQIWADSATPSDTLYLKPLQTGLEVDLQTIEFTPGANELYHTSLPALQALHKFLVVNPTVGIAVVGHEQPTSKLSESTYKSRERARAVWEYLVSQGVHPNRLTVEGEGSRSMRFPEPKSIAEEEANRRVTVRVTHY